MEGSLPPTVYNVVKDHEYHEEIKVGLTFTSIVVFLSHYQFHEILIHFLHFTLESWNKKHRFLILEKGLEVLGAQFWGEYI